MARATTRTLIPLDRAATIIGLDNFHFNSIVTSSLRNDLDCDDLWFQHDWQDTGRFSREALARVLQQAEQVTADYLGYYPIPKWIKNEEHPIAQFFIPEYFSSNHNIRNQGKSIKTAYGYVIAGGIRGQTLVEANSPVTYSDKDGDLYDETATVVVITTVTDPQEIHVFFPSHTGSDDWEIRPVDVSLSGGLATITFSRSLAVIPALWERFPAPDNPSSLIVDGDDTANFLDECDVYRIFNSSASQAEILYEPNSGCVGDGCEGSSDTACLYVRDKRRGFLTYSLATYDEDTGVWTNGCTTCNGVSTKIKVSYYAGLCNEDSPYPNIRMNPELERLIVLYSTTLADTRPPGCDNVENHLMFMKEDLAAVRTGATGSGAIISYQNPMKKIANPLGTTRAAQNLWEWVLRRKIGSAVKG